MRAKEITLEVFSSGKAPDIRAMAEGFAKYMEEAGKDPAEEEAFREWQREYHRTHRAG